MASQTDLPTVTISPDILRLLPRDSDLANSLVNEILGRMLKDEPLGDDNQLVNGPDWQTAVEAGRKLEQKEMSSRTKMLSLGTTSIHSLG